MASWAVLTPFTANDARARVAAYGDGAARALTKLQNAIIDACDDKQSSLPPFQAPDNPTARARLADWLTANGYKFTVVAGLVTVSW